jgi:RNA polymerase sigma-32 factor
MNIMDTYAAEALKHKVLLKEEELALARRFLAGDQRAGQRLVVANLRYAMKVANEFRYTGHPLEDLVQEANLGMLMALRKFDPDRGFRFVSYATWWIRAYIKHYLIHNISLVKFGTTARERMAFGKLNVLMEKVARENPQLDPSDVITLVAEQLCVDREELRLMHGRTMRGSTQSLNTPVHLNPDYDSGATFQDLVPDPTPSALQQLEELTHLEDARRALRAAARNPRELFIVERRLLADDPMTLDELGARLGLTRRADTSGKTRLSRERVRQIEAALLRRARQLVTQ